MDQYALAAQPLIHLPFCPDIAALAGFPGSFAPPPLSVSHGAITETL